MFLELTSFPVASCFERGVVLLATDCNEKWDLALFQNYNTICQRTHSSGRKCWMDLRNAIECRREKTVIGASAKEAPLQAPGG